MTVEHHGSVRTGRRFRPGRLGGPYDALVIGSGIGGLTVAALLAELGRRVAVFEQHYTAGGFTHSYERAGYEWDVGVHYVGDMGAPTMLRRVMDFLTERTVDWAPMDPNYDRFFIGEEVFDAFAGREAFRDELLRRFPKEARAIDRYLALLDEVRGGMRSWTLGRTLSPSLARLAGPLLRRRLPECFGRTTWDVLSEITDDPLLIAVLTGQWGDLGLPPRRSSFAIQATIARHYLHGGYYPVGGSWRIAEAILPRIRRHGGEVYTYARVRELVLRRGRVAGLALADGTTVESDCVISDAGVVNTFRTLLPAAVAREHGYLERLGRVRPSIGHLCLYAGLEATSSELGLPRTNYWIYPGPDCDAALDAFLADQDAPFPAVYISFPSAKDPDFERRHPGRSTIEIVAPAPYERFERWAGTTWGQRGEDYEALKRALGERLLEHLYARLPGLRGRIAYWELSTPLSTQWFGGWPRGELYGLDHSPGRIAQDWLRPRTRVPGLWLTGQDILSCGVAGAMMGGVATASAIAGPRRVMTVLGRGAR